MLLMVRSGEPDVPLGRGGKLGPVASQAGLHPQGDGQVGPRPGPPGLARAWRSDEDHVVPAIDEGQRCQEEPVCGARHHLRAPIGLVGKVGFFDRLASRKASSTKARFSTLGLTGQPPWGKSGALLPQKRCEEILVGPTPTAGLFGNTGDYLSAPRARPDAG